ncbi:MAG: hypothetical protein KAG89_18305 [Fulvimarina manganoxydans]|uniref:DUF6460 domain-containing protein n=1 Tax=Fulvimarina manganoxydans TaxID=937218 RepID=UPI00235537AD|nr:DUF6460 domain-containing protein [Fulvimarina manganoxydans]MCK5934116.1 hypothetical protein [Fulvimarina manganoxydans]
MSGRVERFLGGSPIRVGINLVLMSIAVGLLLSWFDLSPRRLIDGTIDAVMRIIDTVFGSIDNVIQYFLLGAAIVVPIFLISRVLKIGRREDRY